ncbi:MerR family transcriptional regulator [Streptomyces inhibens]|uniref:MerR family transcriptional regulator n=1 Tax=Streptomyces inhibens TaxID=2293571 RepID=UPI001EE6B96D|nr:GyrI-like domain-containing protein [Streptomyces inhibens]UKY51935.1 GyrI-like domain-containing protein [Streptomyces inhibens]
MNDERLLSIGQFARLARLSVKQLRHYADLGLLPPARVDPGTGYRSCRADQARDALSIGLLRSLDVPLAAIGEVLRGPDAARVLAEVRDRLDDELARRRQTLAALEQVLAKGLPSAEVTLRHEEPQRVAVLRDTARSPQDIGRVTGGCVAGLLPLLEHDRAVRLTGLFPVELDGHIPVTIAAALPDGRPVPAGATGDLLPGGLFACATHTGPYGHIALTAHALLAWCAERGHRLTGPFREVYLNDPATTPPERLLTELLIPLEETP